VADRCAHCGESLAGLEVVGGGATPDVQFCCSGCATIHAVLHEAGLDSYYTTRERLPDARSSVAASEAPDDGLDDPQLAARFLDGTRATFAIDGIHCASCGWVIERLLSQDEAVASVSVSVGRERATIQLRDDLVDSPPLGRLARRLGSAGYRARPVLGSEEDPGAGRAQRIEVLRLGVAAACAMNIMLFAVSLYGGEAWGMDPMLRTLFRWLSLGLALPIVGFSAAPILRRAVSALRAGIIHVDVPVAVAICVMFGASAVATVRGAGDVWFDSLGMLVVLLLGGRSLDALARRRTAQRLATLLRHQDEPVVRLTEGRREHVNADALQPGDLIELAPGAVCPVDGTVAAGRSDVDLAAVDGESTPHLLEAGGPLPAGARVLDGVLSVRVVRAAAGSNVARIREAVEAALERRGQVELLADRAARWFVAAVLVLAVLTAAAWAVIDPTRLLPTVVAVLVVACPCALALATPLSFAAAVHGAAARGVLVRDGTALTELGTVTRVAFDKTGTLTRARLEAGALVREGGAQFSDERVLRLAAAACLASRHPVAEAVVEAWKTRAPGPIPPAEDVVEHAGRGVEARVSGHHVFVGRPGASIQIDGDVVGRLLLEGAVRRDAAQAVARLDALGLPVSLLSGDEESRALELGAAIGIPDVRGAMSPADKALWIADQQARGERVAFVGDGLNDAPALAEATSGLAMGGAVDLALEAAAGAVVSRRPAAVADTIALGRRLRRTLRTNIALSVTYNGLAIAGAAAGLITPLAAAILMPISSLVVILNAGRLARKDS